MNATWGLEHPPALQLAGLPEVTDEDKAPILGINAQQALGLQCGSERPKCALSAARSSKTARPLNRGMKLTG